MSSFLESYCNNKQDAYLKQAMITEKYKVAHPNPCNHDFDPAKLAARMKHNIDVPPTISNKNFDICLYYKHKIYFSCTPPHENIQQINSFSIKDIVINFAYFLKKYTKGDSD